MKKYLNLALLYAIAAMISGVFYREFTKLNDFTGVTTLGKVHTRLFLLGMVLFLIVALFAQQQELQSLKSFRAFLRLYNIGLPLTAIMMIVRGVQQVLALPISTGLNAAISGMAGIGHILVSAGIVLLLIALKNSEKSRDMYEKLS